MKYKSNGKIGGIIALVVIIAAVIFLGVVSKGFKNWDFKTWFNTETEEIKDGEEEEGAEVENISALNAVAEETENNYITKIPDPAELPAGASDSVSFSPDGIYLVVGCRTSPYIMIYKRSGDTFIKLSNPASLPTGAVKGISFSLDGTYLAVVHNTSPCITIYKRSGDTFTKLSNPISLPAGNGKGISFSPDGIYLAVTHYTSPYITIYKRSGDTFTKLSNPSSLPTSTGSGVSFSPDGTYLAVAYNGNPGMIVYKRINDTFTKLSDIPSLTYCQGVSFSPDGTYLAITQSMSPFLTILKHSEDTFIKLLDLVGLPDSDFSSFDASFSPDGTYLAVASSQSLSITIYKHSEDTFIKLSNPVSLPFSDCLSVSFSPDGTYLAVGCFESPYLLIYETSLIVTLDVNGGTAEQSIYYVNEGDLFTPPIPEYYGYKFLGWFTEDGELYNPYMPITESFTLMAHWEPLDFFVVTLNVNGGTVEQSLFGVNENEFFIPPTPTYYGYRFLGWYYENGELYNPDIPVTSSFTLTSQWEPILYIVQFNSNGGNNIENVFIQQGKTLTLPVPVRTGYDFKGWILGGGLYAVSPVESNLILVAEWELKIFIVTFNANGGACATVSMKVAYNNTFVLPAEPERTGYIFKGWKINGATYAEGPVTANITLTATWEIIKLTVTFYVDNEAYKSILVDYGTTLYQLREKSTELFLNIKSISFENLEDIGTEFIVTDNVLVVAEKQNTQQSIVTFLTDYWYIVVAGVVLLSLIGVLIFRGSKKGRW